MKRISHGKRKLTPRQEETAWGFIFTRLLTTFTKSLKRTGQVQLEYLVLFSILTAIILVSLFGLHQRIRNNLNEKVFELEAEGLLSVALQHEIDHLDGVLIIDRVSFLKRKRIQRMMTKRQRSHNRIQPES